MTLLDAKEFDPEKESRKRKRLILIITVAVIVICLAWVFRYWREEHIVRKFFDALQKQDFKAAYAIWMHDPNRPQSGRGVEIVSLRQHLPRTEQWSFG